MMDASLVGRLAGRAGGSLPGRPCLRLGLVWLGFPLGSLVSKLRGLLLAPPDVAVLTSVGIVSY